MRARVKRVAPALPRDLKQLQSDLLDALEKTQRRRGEPGVDWVKLERNRMHYEVNTRRRRAGKPAMLLSEIERVERLAHGHSDYSYKFTLYCAELVLAP